MAQDWYTIENIGEIDTPALAVYPDRAKQNISILKNFKADASLLRPHVKTHKSAEISQLLIDAGIMKFKCATIAEAEMLAMTGAPDILLAYQPVGPKAVRFISLIKKYSQSKFSCLIDNLSCAKDIDELAKQAGIVVEVYIDVNIGMNRTGIAPDKVNSLYDESLELKGINIIGLHAYDGHLRDSDLELRTQKCNAGFQQVEQLKSLLQAKYKKNLIIVAGGTPTFPIHAQRKDVECSPGTYIYWDKGYEQTLKEQPYLFAALVITRVISKPAENIITVDLGHKSIASENPLSNRVYFLNAAELQPIGHSEEHLVLKTTPEKAYHVGDVLYGVPYHICPTVALHDRTVVIENHYATGYWNTLSRNRLITI